MSKVLIVVSVLALIGCSGLTIPPIKVQVEGLVDDQEPVTPEQEPKEKEPVTPEQEPKENEALTPEQEEKQVELPTLLEALAGNPPASDAVVLHIIASGKGINDKETGEGSYGWTPLHYAASERSLAIIEALVRAGAKRSGDDWDDEPKDEVEDNERLTKAQKAEAYLLLGGEESDETYKSLIGS